jgi:fibronectin-binding autotransporter adhesin
VVLFLVMLMLGPSSASAATCAFEDAGSGLWHDDANWSCGNIPTADDAAVIGTDDSVTVDQDADITDLSLDDTGTITFADDSTLSPTGIVAVSAGTLTGPGTLTVGETGSFAKSTDGQLTVTSSADLILNADGSLEGGSICLEDSAPLSANVVVNKTFTIDVPGGAAPFPCSSPIHTLRIGAPDGHLVIAGSDGASIFSRIDNDGQVTVEDGTLKLSGAGPGTSTGTYETLASATTEFGPWGFLGTMTLGAGGAITGAGAMRIGGDITVQSGATFTPTGTLTHTGGMLEISDFNTLDPATYNLEGGTLKSIGELTPATMNVTSGTLTGPFNTTIEPGATFAKTSSGTLNLANQADLVLNADATLEGGGICLDASISPTTAQINKTLTVSGTGGFPLTAPSCFGSSNTTQLSVFVNGPDGHLLKSDSGSLQIGPRMAVSGEVSIASDQTLGLTRGAELTGGGVLRGGGQVNGNVANTSGTVRPGSSPGTLTINGNYTQGPGGTLEADVAGTTPGTEFDVLDVNGSATLGGKLEVLKDPAFDPLLGDAFAVMTSNSRSGTFATLDAPALPDGNSFQLTYPGSPDFGARLEVGGLQAQPPDAGGQPPPLDGGDTNPPDTTITQQPKDKTKKTTATFAFASSEPGSTFQCAVDGQALKVACTSPYTVKVKKGKHTFLVQAIDAAGNADATPASDAWKVRKKK